MPATQGVPTGQRQPQAPQLSASFCRSRQPLGDQQQVMPTAHAGSPLQPQIWSGPSRTLQVSPGWHVASVQTQAPATQS